MKQFMNLLRYGTRPLVTLLLVTLFFSACKKNDHELVTQPASGLMAFNLAPDKGAIGFTLAGNQLGNQPLGYSNFTGGYLPVLVGNREVKSFDFSSGSTIAIGNGNFVDSMYYSLFLVGTNGQYRNILVKDELDILEVVTGKAWVRYINAIPDSSTALGITFGENTSSENAPYATVSAFKPVNAGAMNINISNSGNIAVSRPVTLEANKIYTVIFSGIPGQSDPNKAVQIRFIQNGTVSQ